MVGNGPIDMNQVVGRDDILFVTFDSLRHDTATRAFAAGRTPNLARMIGPDGWGRRETAGTFTLPAHMAFFHGFLPEAPERRGAPRLFALAYQGARTIGPTTRVFDDAPDVIRGLAGAGYLTVCVGGVGFFDRRNALGRVLPGFFEESVWTPQMGVDAPESTAAQARWAIERIGRLELGRRLLLFINVSATHVPHHYYLPGAAQPSVATQIEALAYADRELGPLFEVLAARGPLFGILCADHGEAYGEDGRCGHRIAHPSVTTVPYAEFRRGYAAP